jgi:hypothetical protein
MPQILKGFGLGNIETGFLNMIPFGIASVFMIFWGLRADKSGERIWSTALPLALKSAGFALTLLTNSLGMTLLLSLVLLGNYAIKGPFFALATEMLPPSAAAAGIAAINTLAHLGTGHHLGYRRSARQDRQLSDCAPAAMHFNRHWLSSGVLDRS